MNKNMFRKVVCLVIALMMMMPAMPSSLVSAAEEPVIIDNPLDNSISTVTTGSAITFTVEHYKQLEDGTFPEIASETEKFGTFEKIVHDDDYQKTTYDGYTYVSGLVDGETSVMVLEDESSVVKLYYNLDALNIPVMLAGIGDGGVYTTEAGVMDAMGQSTNNHLVGYLAWVEEGTENLYVAFNASNTAVDLKTLIGVIYYDGAMNDTSYYYDELTGIYEKIHGPINIDGVQYGPNDPVTNMPYEFTNWLVINLGEITFSDPFYIGLDYAENGFDAMGDKKIRIEILDYTVEYHANGADGGSTSDPNFAYEQYDWVTVLDNGFTYTNHNFVKWNTLPDGSGDNYYPGQKFQMPNHDVELYAIWSTVPQNSFTVEHYLQNSDGTTYPATPTYTETDSANTGATVYDDTYENSYPGWTYVSGAVDGVTSAVVEAPNGTTKLKLYYTVDSVGFTVEHYLQNSDGTTYPATPT
ncbi:hypothetical protein LY60_03534, partial [Sedimentibacter saalensis]